VAGASSKAIAGWYADPFGRYHQRRWDGTRWTEAVIDGGVETTDSPGTNHVNAAGAMTGNPRQEPVTDSVPPSEEQVEQTLKNTEIARLTRLEVNYAARTFLIFQERLRGPGYSNEDVRLRALRLTYYAVATRWIRIAAPISFAAGCVWSFHDSLLQDGIAAALTAVALVPCSFIYRRVRQAKQYWPETVRLPRPTP
jgi:hypothetical protein